MIKMMKGGQHTVYSAYFFSSKSLSSLDTTIKHLSLLKVSLSFFSVCVCISGLGFRMGFYLFCVVFPLSLFFSLDEECVLEEEEEEEEEHKTFIIRL